MADPPKLPRRIYGNSLPPEAYRAIGVAKVQYPPDSRWADDEAAVRMLLNGLRRWNAGGQRR